MNTHSNTEINYDQLLETLLHRTAKLMMRSQHLSGHTEHAQMRVLSILQQNKGSMNQRILLEILNVRSASLSELLGKLALRQYIVRTRDERDKRNIVISLTKQGMKAIQVNQSARQDSSNSAFTTFSQTERVQLAQLLQKLIHSLQGDKINHHSEHNEGHIDQSQHDQHISEQQQYDDQDFRSRHSRGRRSH